MPPLRLIVIQKDGTVNGALRVSEAITEISKGAVEYFAPRYLPPWVSYVAFDGEESVGTCAFKTAPVGGYVEIAYMTLEERRGKGYATAMVRQLFEIAQTKDPSVKLRAQTLPGPNASARVLTKAGFVYMGDEIHPEDGLVSEWRMV